MKINILTVDTLKYLHFEIIADNGNTFYYRDYVNSLSITYKKPIGIENYANRNITLSAKTTFEKVSNLFDVLAILKQNLNGKKLTLFKQDKIFTQFRYKKYGNINVLVELANYYINSENLNGHSKEFYYYK